MSCTTLEKDKLSHLREIKDLGSGNYGRVKLFYDKNFKRKVVGKVFQSGGEQEKSKKRLADAKKEAKILSRFSHKHIVLVFGSVLDDQSFMIIMEYAPCKDLENLLMSDRHIPLPWKLRARFFTELASALDYLHYHDPERSYIHGDLKPQNVLLGNALEIKLADFGAATIAQLTGATSISGNENTQHTPLYTAPEYLKKLIFKQPTTKRKCNMDVYSYGMIGYEILTRQTVYSGSEAPINVVLTLIIQKGLKPNEQCINEVASAMVKNSCDFKILTELNNCVKKCWQSDPENRPKICDVKSGLDKLAQLENIYSKNIDQEAKLFIQKRNLKQERDSNQRTSDTAVIEQRIPFIPILAMLIVLVIATAFGKSFLTFEASEGFLVAQGSSLGKYFVSTKRYTNISHCSIAENWYRVKQVLKLNNMVYVVGEEVHDDSNQNKYTVRIISLNLSDSSYKCKEDDWNEKYKSRRYIVLEQCIFAIGGSCSRYRSDAHNFFISSADFYNTTTGKWTKLPNMNEARRGPTLVLFKGLICAVGGVNLQYKTVECFNKTENKWTNLPPMIVERRNAAAVELNGELYVIGGFDKDGSKRLNAVEKFNPATEQWIEVNNLNKPRANYAAGVFKGKIYVLGGGANLIEAYDPAKNIWEEIEYRNDINYNAKSAVF